MSANQITPEESNRVKFMARQTGVCLKCGKVRAWDGQGDDCGRCGFRIVFPRPTGYGDQLKGAQPA